VIHLFLLVVTLFGMTLIRSINVPGKEFAVIELPAPVRKGRGRTPELESEGTGIEDVTVSGRKTVFVGIGSGFESSVDPDRSRRFS